MARFDYILIKIDPPLIIKIKEYQRKAKNVQQKNLQRQLFVFYNNIKKMTFKQLFRRSIDEIFIIKRYL